MGVFRYAFPVQRRTCSLESAPLVAFSGSLFVICLKVHNDTLGMTPRTIQLLVKRVANRARISRTVSPRVLQHIFAVAAVQKGISLPALQRLLGHDRLTTTEVYLNLSPEDVVREFREKW
ncbi:MAG: tyrosine-type recombinase/integrase [Nitrospinae bacterium]|nr:tyrosine-type recombinase/integrase [Nitrospinota bacterium]